MVVKVRQNGANLCKKGSTPILHIIYMENEIVAIGGELGRDLYKILISNNDRIEATLYYNEQSVYQLEKQNIKKSVWYARSALAEFSSSFEVLNRDLRDQCLDKIYSNTGLKSKFESNYLFRGLKTSRNITIHTNKKRIQKDKYVYMEWYDCDWNESENDGLFLQPITDQDQQRTKTPLNAKQLLKFNLITPKTQHAKFFLRVVTI